MNKVIRNFEAMKMLLKERNIKKPKLAVVCAEDKSSLEANFALYKEGIIDFVLLGNRAEIFKLSQEIVDEDTDFLDIISSKIIETGSDIEAAKSAVAMIKRGEADFLFKGMLQTATLLKEVVNKESGLGVGNLMSSVVLMDIPAYHKILVISDPGMVISPDLDKKIEIVKNASELLHRLGYDRPKIAGLCALETVNPKMIETVDAVSLTKLCEEGKLGECIFEGPMAIDIAINKAMGEHKGVAGEVVGDADVLLMPNISAGNMLVKSLMILAGAKMAGLVMGAGCPIVLNSRSAGFEERYYSIIACCLSV